MTLYSVQLKVAADSHTAQPLKETLPATLFDGFEPLPEENALPINELRISSFDELLPLMKQDEKFSVRRLVLDARAFASLIPRLLVFLSPILYRWDGEEFCLIVSEEKQATTLLPALNDLLRSLELRSRGVRIISCPTCARCRTDFPSMVRSIEQRLEKIEKPLDVAVMGCEVNGPGEAKAADIGIAFGDQKGMLFKNGEKVRVVSIEEAADALMDAIEEA